jgi:hypothetical protein
MRGSRLFLGGTRMIEWSAGLKPSAVAGRLSVTRLTQSNWTGMSASGMPRSTVRKMLTTSPIFEETEITVSHCGERGRWMRLTEIANELLGVVVDQASLLDSLLDGREVRVGEHHVRGELGDVRAGAHGHTDVSLLERGRIVDTIAGLYKDQ